MIRQGYRIGVTLLTIATVICVPVARSETYTFTPSSGDWDVPTNWSPEGGPPEAGDTAIIPSGRTCIVGDADQEVFKIELEGTLIVRGRTLRLTNSGSSGPEIDVGGGGTLRFEKPDEATPVLLFKGAAQDPSLDIITGDGPGTVIADGSSGHAGQIQSDGNYNLAVGAGVTVKGSLSILNTGGLNNGGKFLVDDADDTMYLGTTTAGLGSVGTGTFEVAGGQMVVRRLMPFGDGCDVKYKVSGGTLRFTEYTAPPIQSDCYVEISGGTIEFNADWISHGGFKQTGGSIVVKSGSSAEFDDSAAP